jgi:hypothetical protein
LVVTEIVILISCTLALVAMWRAQSRYLEAAGIFLLPERGDIDLEHDARVRRAMWTPSDDPEVEALRIHARRTVFGLIFSRLVPLCVIVGALEFVLTEGRGFHLPFPSVSFELAAGAIMLVAAVGGGYLLKRRGAAAVPLLLLGICAVLLYLALLRPVG